MLECAVEVASTKGLEGLTIGQLAADLGISKGHLTVLFSPLGLQLFTAAGTPASPTCVGSNEEEVSPTTGGQSGRLLAVGQPVVGLLSPV